MVNRLSKLFIFLAFSVVALPSTLFAQSNFWPTLIQHFQFKQEQHLPQVQHYIHYYQSHPVIVDTLLSRAAPSLPYIAQQVIQHKLPGEIALLPLVESGYSAQSNSTAGAQGFWQLMPQTIEDYGFQPYNLWLNPRVNIITSTEVALKLLSHLYYQFNHNWFLALAAYNAGQGTVQQALSLATAQGKTATYWQLNLPEQTKQYVPKLLAICYLIQNAQHTGMPLPSVANINALTTYTLPYQTEIHQLENYSHLSATQFTALNPGFQTPITPPNGSTLLLPASHLPTLKIALTKHAKLHTFWHLFQVKHHQTLQEISAATHNSITQLMQLNHLSSPVLHPGQMLIYQSPYPKEHYWYYLVQPGDTLDSIAIRLGVSKKDIERWNGFSAHAPLKTHENLLITQ